MYLFQRLIGEYSNLQLLSYVTLIQLWWIAIWGISYILIEYLSNKSKTKEICIYILLLLIIFTIIISNPHLMKHL
jgi:hypothetical protein